MTNPISEPTQDAARDAMPAAEVDALTPVLHRPTDGVAPPAASELGGQADPPSQPTGELDAKGQPFDPGRHQAGPDGRGVKTARGTWKLHGSRGRPFSPGNKAAAKEDEPPAGGDSFIGAPGAPEPGDGGDAVRDGVVDPPAAIDRDGYGPTAIALVRSSFGVCRLLMGKAWEPSPQEAKEWKEAWQDALVEWQAPRLGATLTLLVLAITSASSRADDERTRAAAGGLVDWLARLTGFGRRRPAPTQPGPAPAPMPASVGPQLPAASANGSPVYDFTTGRRS